MMELNFAHERIPTGVEEISLACDLLGGDIRRLYPRRYDRFSPFRETVPHRCCVSLCGRLLGFSVGRILLTYLCV
jgi:hypothetical protein